MAGAAARARVDQQHLTGRKKMIGVQVALDAIRTGFDFGFVAQSKIDNSTSDPKGLIQAGIVEAVYGSVVLAFFLYQSIYCCRSTLPSGVNGCCGADADEASYGCDFDSLSMVQLLVAALSMSGGGLLIGGSIGSDKDVNIQIIGIALIALSLVLSKAVPLFNDTNQIATAGAGAGAGAAPRPALALARQAIEGTGIGASTAYSNEHIYQLLQITYQNHVAQYYVLRPVETSQFKARLKWFKQRIDDPTLNAGPGPGLIIPIHDLNNWSVVIINQREPLAGAPAARQRAIYSNLRGGIAAPPVVRNAITAIYSNIVAGNITVNTDDWMAGLLTYDDGPILVCAMREILTVGLAALFPAAGSTLTPLRAGLYAELGGGAGNVVAAQPNNVRIIRDLHAAELDTLLEAAPHP